MRRYDIVFGILLTLSITDFALAAPVLVQEHQAQVDGVPIPEDVMTVSRKRAYDDMLKMMEEGYLKADGKPMESSDTHASASSSAPPGPDDHGSTNVAQAPPASTPPEPLTSWDPNNMLEPPATSEAPLMGWDPNNMPDWDPSISVPPWTDDNAVGHGSDEGWIPVHLPKIEPKPKPDTETYSSAWQSSAPNPASSTAKPDSLTEASSPQVSPSYLDPAWSGEEAQGPGSGYTSDF
jgi:hypothetical protein